MICPTHPLLPSRREKEENQSFPPPSSTVTVDMFGQHRLRPCSTRNARTTRIIFRHPRARGCVQEGVRRRLSWAPQKINSNKCILGSGSFSPSKQIALCTVCIRDNTTGEMEPITGGGDRGLRLLVLDGDCKPFKDCATACRMMATRRTTDTEASCRAKSPLI